MRLQRGLVGIMGFAACLALSACAGLPLRQTQFRQAQSPQAQYRNPVLFADYSDPDVIRADKSYYLVASSFHFSPGIPILKSDDLVHWTIIGHVLPKLKLAPEYDMPGPFDLDDTKSKPITGTKYGAGVWAPAIRYHAGLFYVYFPTPDEGIFVATTKDPSGPWSAPVAVMAQKGLEDPCPLWDDDGQAYLIHGKVGAGPLILHRMSKDGMHVLDEGVVVADDKVNLPVLEGPKLYKRNGWYYIFAPIGGVSTGPQAVGRAKSIYGPYEWRTVLNPSDAVKGPHQGGYVETPSGQGWFMHFNSTGAFGRVDHLQPVTWVDDWPVMGEAGQPVLQYATPDTEAKTRAHLQDSDDFNAATLGLQWSWNHNPDDQNWSLTKRPGYLRLTAAKSDHLVTARNTLTQVLQGPQSRIETRMDVSKMQEGQRAGLSLFGVKPVWIGAVRQDGVTHIAYSSAGVETLGPVITQANLTLRALILADQTTRFAYSLDGKTYTSFGEALPLSPFSWWKGSRPALFTYSREEEGGYVDFDWVKVTAKIN